MQTAFRGVFLTSRNPEATAKFYRDVAYLPLETVGEPDSYVLAAGSRRYAAGDP